ncbi:MAG: NADAR family protein [Rhizobiaceae bacterium]|nr:NADAR family protein [Rhizobiaceae bacterium]
MTARLATVDELHVFLVGEIARRNRAAADLQRPIIPGREDRAVELLLASVDACGLLITREVPMTDTSDTLLSRVDAAIAVTRSQTATTIDTHLFMGLLGDVRAALQAPQEAVLCEVEKAVADFDERFPGTRLSIAQGARRSSHRFKLDAPLSPQPAAAPSEDEPEKCPICAEPFKPGDMCASDVTEGMCHAACLEGAAIVELESGEPSDGPATTYPYPAQPEAQAVPEGCHGLDTPERVCFYEQDFYVLSNFSSFAIEWKGLNFNTSEAAYHWEKFDAFRPSVAAVIRSAPSAHEAFKIAERNKHLRRPDWDEVKVDIMRDILRAKADQHEYVRRKLLATGDRELVENSWRDDFWGWGPNRDGKNMLGKLWMEVRAELRSTTSPATGGA